MDTRRRRLAAIGIVAFVATGLHLSAAEAQSSAASSDKPASASADEAAVRTILERMGPALPSLDAPSELPPAEQSIDDPLAVGGPVTDTKAIADQIASERDATAQELRQALDAFASERLAKDAAAQELRQARDALASERLAKDAAARDLREARDALVSERLAKDAAVQELREARDAFASERLAKDAAVQELREARGALVSERLAKDAAAQELREARDVLALEREKSSRLADEIARLLESTASLKTIVLARDAALQAMSEQHSAEIARERERSDQLAHDVTLARGDMAAGADRCEGNAHFSETAAGSAHAAFGACAAEVSSGLPAASPPLHRKPKLSFLDPATPHPPFPAAAPTENSLRPATASSEPVSGSSGTKIPRIRDVEPAAAPSKEEEGLPGARCEADVLAAAQHSSRTTTSPPDDDAERLILRAAALLAQKDVGGARLVLERAADLGNGLATFRLAETYDQAVLTTWGSRIRGDKAKAAEFYRRAASLGVTCKRVSH